MRISLLHNKNAGDGVSPEVLREAIKRAGHELVQMVDGFFSVVSAGEEHRECLAEYLRHRIEGTDCRLCLPTRRARQVEIHGWPDVHVDDKVRSGPSMGTVSICMEPAALRFLV